MQRLAACRVHTRTFGQASKRVSAPSRRLAEILDEQARLLERREMPPRACRPVRDVVDGLEQLRGPSAVPRESGDAGGHSTRSLPATPESSPIQAGRAIAAVPVTQ